MYRFFVGEEQVDQGKVAIIGQDAKHIRDVLRLKPGDEIEIIRAANVLRCELTEVSRTAVECKTLKEMEKRNEPVLKIVLFQGMPKSVKMETILQKCTEIGVSEFCPVATERSVVKIKDIDKETKKLERWNSIIEEAAKQSKRDVLPRLSHILSFDAMIEKLKGKLILVPYELELENSLKDFISSVEDAKEVCVVIGPEGGFEDEEIHRLKEIGAHTVTLGRRILRTETAGMIVSGILLFAFGDLGVIK